MINFVKKEYNTSKLDINNYDYLDDRVDFQNVIFDLRNIKEKLEHRETYITIRGSNQCLHLDIDKNGVCNACGAYHYPLGAEPTSTEYYKHLYYIAHKLKADTVMFITERFYPDDFKISAFDTYKISSRFRLIKTKTLISGFNPLWKIKKGVFDRLYLVIFSNTLKDETEDFIVSNDFEFQINEIINRMVGSKVYYDKINVPEYKNRETIYKGFEKVFHTTEKMKKQSLF